MGVPGNIELTAGFAVVAILVLLFYVPRAPRESLHERQPAWRDTIAVLSDHELLRLDAGIFVLHAILTALFVAVPLALRDAGHLEVRDHWHVYLPVMLVSLLGTIPMLYFAERRGHLKTMFLAAIGLLVLAQFGLAAAYQSLWKTGVLLTLFFSGFNLLEATLPSLISRSAPQARRGAAMGVYSSLQFLGTFCGGALGGLVLGRLGMPMVFVSAAVLALLWLAVALPMRPPAPRRAGDMDLVL
jgi:predicted MFS family arabinose efflux permease